LFFLVVSRTSEVFKEDLEEDPFGNLQNGKGD